MKRFGLLVLSLAVISFGANAQELLNRYQPGPRLIDGAQLNQMVDTVNSVTGNTTAGALAASNLTAAKVTTTNAPPVLSTCGTDPTIVGSNLAGRLVTGSALTTCTITFSTAFTGAPFCVVSAEVPTQPTYTVSASAITFSVSIASTAYHYHCIARSGG